MGLINIINTHYSINLLTNTEKYVILIISKEILARKGVLMKEIEIWNNVGILRGIDYSELYEASTFGRVRSVDRTVKFKDGKTRDFPGVVLSPYKNKKTGYMQVSLLHNGKSATVQVHELVMSAHCPNPNPEIYTDINHIDEDKTNNRLDNLEWTTHKKNCNHGTAIKRRSQRIKRKFIPIVQLSLSGNIINVYYSTEEIKDSTFYKDIITRVINRKTYIYNKCFWIRLDEYNNLSFNELINLINEKISKSKDNNKCKKVIQLSTNEEFIKEYDSVTDAAKEMGCTRQAIQQCISGKQTTCNGYKWAYK